MTAATITFSLISAFLFFMAWVWREEDTMGAPTLILAVISTALTILLAVLP